MNKENSRISEDLITPELSLVLPCYNEECCLEKTVPPLAAAFRRDGISLQIVLVDNGSRDLTSEVIDRLICRGLPVTKGVVPVNQGQGLGFLTGFALCTGRYIGYLCADGHVAPEDVVALFHALRNASTPRLVKVRRRYRPDSWLRKLVSIFYNVIMQLVFPGMPSLDVNGNPKIMPAAVLRLMELTSKDWFLEAEVMLKARHLGIPVIEMDVIARAQQGRPSHVRCAAVLEFIGNIIAYRVGGSWQVWRKRNPRRAAANVVSFGRN